MSQRTIMGRIKALTFRIVDMQGKFDLPKGHADRWETYGGATSLQRARTQRAGLQASLDPIQLIATGVSCRDCLHFADLDEPLCWYFRDKPTPTKFNRSNLGDCGPEARSFDAHRLANA